MKILDIYISRKFISTLLFTLVAFISIFIIVDLIDRLSQFLSHQVPKWIIIQYYFYYIPFIIVLILPVAILLSSLFSVGNLAHFNEIIAMKSSGISLNRILLPLYLIAFLISVFVIYFGEKIVPFTNQKMFNIERIHLGKHSDLAERRTNIYFRDPQCNGWIFINHFDPRLQRANRVSIQYINDHKIVSRIDAQQMNWEANGWTLINGYERKISGENIKPQYFDERRFEQISYKPVDFERAQKKHEEMTYGELKKFVEEVAQNGGEPQTWLVDLYIKISFPFSNFIIMLFGAPLAAGKPRSGKAFGFGVSLFVAFFFFGFFKTGQALGHSGVLHPLLAAWLSNLIFLAAAIVLIIKIK